MTDYRKEFEQVIREVSSALGKKIDSAQYEIFDRGVPHEPPKPKELDGKMGIYTFLYKDRFLKIGRVGSGSPQRFSYQHYKAKSAGSTLADSLIADPKMGGKINDENVKDWIQKNCRRIDVLIDEKLGVFAVALIEAAFHYYYEPKYEGFDSQRKNKS